MTNYKPYAALLNILKSRTIQTFIKWTKKLYLTFLNDIFSFNYVLGKKIEEVSSLSIEKKMPNMLLQQTIFTQIIQKYCNQVVF